MSRFSKGLRRWPFALLGREGLRRVTFVMPYIRGRDVLDVGIVQHTVEAYDHPAWLHRHIRREARSCFGVDYLAEGVEFVKSKGFDVAQADAENLDLGRTFDVVVAGEIIEHLSNVGAFLEGAKRHLRSAGRLIITTPNPWFVGRGWEALFGEPLENAEHTAWFSIRMLAELLRRHSFRVESVQYGSSEHLPWIVPIVPARLRHTSIWLVARVYEEPSAGDAGERPKSRAAL